MEKSDYSPEKSGKFFSMIGDNPVWVQKKSNYLKLSWEVRNYSNPEPQNS